MRILVTGASGLVGSVVAEELLAQGHHVRLAVRRPEAARQFVGRAEVATIGDLSEPVDWSRHLEGIDAVVHAAGVAHEATRADERRMFEVNVNATDRLMRAASRSGVKRAIFISSVRAIADTSEPDPIGEDHPPAPTNAYGRSKRAAEGCVLASGLSGIILRPPLVHGAGVRGNLGWLARFAASRVPLPLGGLTGMRSIVSDRNLASAVAHLLRPRFQPQPMSTALVADLQPMTVSTLVTILRASLGRPPGLFKGRTAIDMLGRVGMFERVCKSLAGRLELVPTRLAATGWRPIEGSEAGLARVMRGYSAAD